MGGRRSDLANIAGVEWKKADLGWDSENKKKDSLSSRCGEGREKFGGHLEGDGRDKELKTTEKARKAKKSNVLRL